MIMTPSISESNCMFNTCRVELVFVYRLFYASKTQSLRFLFCVKVNFIFFFYYYFFWPRRKVVEFLAWFLPRFPLFFPPFSFFFFYGFFLASECLFVDTYPNPRKFSLMMHFSQFRFLGSVWSPNKA